MRFNHYLMSIMSGQLNLNHLQTDRKCNLVTNEEYDFLIQVWMIVDCKENT